MIIYMFFFKKTTTNYLLGGHSALVFTEHLKLFIEAR